MFEENEPEFMTPPATLVASDAPANTSSNYSADATVDRLGISRVSLVGQVIGGHFEIESLLGEGGISVVYKARHMLLGTPVAIKFLLPGTELNANAIMRFQREAQAMAELNHSAIAGIREFGIHQAIPYLVIEFVEGDSLDQILKDKSVLESRRALGLFRQVVSAVSHAHSHKIIHRDLKPSNVMVYKEKDGSEAIKIIDFGISKSIEDIELRNLTQTGDVFGTPSYMSPEQCQGMRVDQRSDIYSLGCMAYEMFSGRPPFTGAQPLEVIMKHVSERHKPLKPVKGMRGLNKVIDGALAKDPKFRYQSCDQLLSDLKLLADGQEPIGTKASGGKLSFNGRKLLIVLIGILVGFLVLYVWFISTFKTGTIESVTKDIETNPSATNYYLRGRYHRDAGHYKEALADTAKSLELQPKSNYWAHRIRSDVFVETGDFKAALDEAELSVIAKPEEYRAYMCRGIALYKVGRDKDAVADFDKSLKLNHDPVIGKLWSNRSVTLYYRAAALNRLGRHEEALEDIDLACQTDARKSVTPNSADTWHTMLLTERALANLGLKRFDEALSAAQQACDDDPADVKAKNILKQVQAAVNKTR